MSHTLEEIIAKRRADRGDPSPIGGDSGGEAPPEDNSLEGIIARRRAQREAETPVAGPPAPDPAQAAKDTAWLDKQRADQMGIPIGLYQNLIKPVGEVLPTLYSSKEYAEGIPRGFHGLDSPTGESGLLAPERVGHLAGTGRDVAAGVSAAGIVTALNPFAAPVTAPLAFGTASGLSQYSRTTGYRPNAGAESLVGGALNAAGGPILKGLGMGAKFVAPEFTAAVSNRLSGAGGQMLLGAGLGGAQEALRGGSAADIGEQMIGGGAAGYGSKRLGDYLGPKILENFPGSFGDKLRMQATAHEAARAGVSPEAMARASPGGQAASSNASIPLDPIVQAALPWGPGGRVARAGYRAVKGMWNQGTDERALYEKVWDTMTPGEEWTPTPKSGEPLERGPATGPNQPNQPLPVDRGGALFPGPLGPPQPPMEPQGPLQPQGPIQGTQVAPKFGGPIPRFPRFGGGAGGGVPEAPPMGPQRGLPQPSEEEIADLLGQTRGPLAGTSRFGTVNPAEGVRPSETLESTFPGGIQRFQKLPPATPAITAERSAVKGALRKAAREGLEGQGPPEELPPAPPPKSPQRPIGPRPSAAPIGKAPPATIAPEALSVTKPAPPAAPPAAPATPKATFYEGKGGEVVRITGEKVETLGEGGKVLTSEEVKDRVRGVGKILGTMGARRVSDPERIAELLKRGSTPKAAAPVAPKLTEADTQAHPSAPHPPTAASEPERLQKSEPIPEKDVTPEKSTGRTLTPDHEARKAGLETPYPEEPDKTHGEKFQEVMRRVSKDGRLVEVDHQHMGLGNDATKRGKHFTMRGQIREGVQDRLTGEFSKPHNPKSGAWMISLEEGFNAPEGTPANKFRRSASPFSVTEVRDAHNGEVLYRGPKIGGGPEELPPTEPKGPSEPPKPTAPDKLKATEPPKPAEALSAEAELKAQMEAETDPDKKFELMQKWETLRKKTGLGTGGGQVKAAEPEPATPKRSGPPEPGEVVRPKSHIPLDLYREKIATMDPAEADRKLSTSLAKTDETEITMDRSGDEILREAVRLAMKLMSHPGSNLKRVTIADKHGKVQTEINRVGAPPPYVRPEQIPIRGGATVPGTGSVQPKVRKLFEDMVAKGEPGEIEIAKGVKLEFRPKPKKE